MTTEADLSGRTLAAFATLWLLCGVAGVLLFQPLMVHHSAFVMLPVAMAYVAAGQLGGRGVRSERRRRRGPGVDGRGGVLGTAGGGAVVRRRAPRLPCGARVLLSLHLHLTRSTPTACDGNQTLQFA
jgi:hypothetical protein